MAGQKAPAISVVVPSHARALRLRWLLNGLEDQSLDSSDFEVVLVHDYTGDEAAAVAQHPLAARGVLREILIEPGTGSAARQRNMGWRAARARHVAFIDDDCRPAEDWLERLAAVVQQHPADIVQGTTRPDPYEVASFASPYARSLWVTPPHDYAQTCNIAYPVAVLEAVDGFDEKLPAPAGEDTDLAERARAAGADPRAAEDAQVFHAVEAHSLRAAVRLNWKWRHLAFVVKRHPRLRQHFTHRIFWRRTHRDMLLLLVGVAIARRLPPALLLAGPWLYRRLLRRGPNKKAMLASVVELPGGAVVDCAEVGTLVWGSLRYRTLLL